MYHMDTTEISSKQTAELVDHFLNKEISQMAFDKYGKLKLNAFKFQFTHEL